MKAFNGIYTKWTRRNRDRLDDRPVNTSVEHDDDDNDNNDRAEFEDINDRAIDEDMDMDVSQ